MYNHYMKRRDLEKKLRELGWYLLRQGKHEIWTNGELTEPVPRHNEIDEYTARSILRKVAANPPKAKEL